MKFVYSRHNLVSSEAVLERLFEIVPGALSWLIIIGTALLSWKNPWVAAVLMIAFILYWLLRLVYMNIFLILSYGRLAVEEKIDWQKRLDDIDQLDFRKDIAVESNMKERISAYIHHKQLQYLRKHNIVPPLSKDIYHLVIIPVIKESRSIVEPGIVNIVNGMYPPKRILVIIAVEENAVDMIKGDAKSLREKYKSYLLDLEIVIHPRDIPGEARVKGANATYAAKYASQYFAKLNIPNENIIVSCFDADTVARPNYFSCLTYSFLTTPERLQTSYQPVPVYYNNIWDAPSFARIIDIGASFFQLIEATNPDKLVTFSSHSMSFKALVDIGYWPVDMISDDSAIFWKAFIHYDGEYQTVPIYTTVSMDIVTGKNWRETFASIYKQKRRWAWGVENFPIVMRAFLKSTTISFAKKLSYSFKLLDSFVSWATWSFLLSLLSWLPSVFANMEFESSAIYYLAPRIQTSLFSLASAGLIVCIVISLLLLPKQKESEPFFFRILHIAEWIFIPVVVLVLSALPALDAQTRLMTGRYMEFWVTDKYRKTPS